MRSSSAGAFILHITMVVNGANKEFGACRIPYDYDFYISQDKGMSFTIPFFGGYSGFGDSCGMFFSDTSQPDAATPFSIGACYSLMIVIISILTLVFALPLLVVIVTLKF